MNLLNSSQWNYRFHAVSRRGKFTAAAAYENHAAWRRSAAADNTETIYMAAIIFKVNLSMIKFCWVSTWLHGYKLVNDVYVECKPTLQVIKKWQIPPELTTTTSIMIIKLKFERRLIKLWKTSFKWFLRKTPICVLPNAENISNGEALAQ